VKPGITDNPLHQSYACIECIILHAFRPLIFDVPDLFWRGFCGWMQLHDNRCTKRAGVAGIALRARRVNMFGSISE